LILPQEVTSVAVGSSHPTGQAPIWPLREYSPPREGNRFAA